MIIIFGLTVAAFCWMIYPLPKPSEIQTWLMELRDYEKITADQLKYKKEFNAIKTEISQMDTSVAQAQNERRIGENIRRLRSKAINKDGAIHSGFNKTGAMVLQVYIDAKQELAVDLRTYEMILEQLEEVRSNIDKDGLSAPRY